MLELRQRRGHHSYDLMVDGFTTTCAISTNHHWSCEFESCSWQVYLIQHFVIKFCQWLAAGGCFSPGIPVSSTNKTDCHDIIEILLKVALNITNLIHQRMLALTFSKYKAIQTVYYPSVYHVVTRLSVLHKLSLFP